jgi:hypothetical protein
MTVIDRLSFARKHLYHRTQHQSSRTSGHPPKNFLPPRSWVWSDFNLAAFTPTSAGAGRFGNAGVGILQGPGTAAVSLGLAKNFALTERAKLRFEPTFTNVLNHTNFAPPATQVDNASTFGVLSAPQTAENAGNRTGQVALRLEF